MTMIPIGMSPQSNAANQGEDNHNVEVKLQNLEERLKELEGRVPQSQVQLLAVLDGIGKAFTDQAERGRKKLTYATTIEEIHDEAEHNEQTLMLFVRHDGSGVFMNTHNHNPEPVTIQGVDQRAVDAFVTDKKPGTIIPVNVYLDYNHVL